MADPSAEPATLTNTVCRIVVPLTSSRTCVQPAGAVMTGAARVDTAATSTSPGCTPAGDGAATAVVVLVAVAWPTKVIGPVAGGGVGVAGVVTLAAVDGADTFPAASTAVTV